jgi:N-acetylglucosamine-6-phosphate deacetylase
VDFNDQALTASQVVEATEKMQATGVTLFLATLISQPLARFAPCARTLVRSGVPALAGLHMEGPYISPEDGARGAHRREDIEPPTIDDFARRQEAAEGHITVVTIAPEVTGAMTLIDYMVKHGVRVSIGHTAAPPAAIREAIARGATLSRTWQRVRRCSPVTQLRLGQLAADDSPPASSSMAITCRRRR